MKENRWARRARELAADGDSITRSRALQSAHCPSDIVVTFLSDQSPWLRRLAWAHPNLPLEQMQESVGRLPDPASYTGRARWSLTHYDSPYLVIHNPNLPADLVAQFPEEYAIAHANCPEETLLASMKPTNPRYRQNRTAITKNKGLPESIQLSYITPDLDTVQNRTYLAENPALTAVTIAAWIPQETHPPILRSLLKRKNTTAPLRAKILARLNALAAANGKPLSQVDRAAVARYSTDPNEVVAALMPDPRKAGWIPAIVLTGALHNPATPTSVIVTACNHPNKTMRKAAAKHHNCPEEGRVIVGLRS